jgi:hypothetical protein
MERKVYIFVKDDEILTYHNLRQLTNAHKLPYHLIYRTLAKDKTYKKDGILIKSDVISCHRKPRKAQNYAF